MNRVLRCSVMTVFLLCACFALAQSAPQALGDYARSVKKSKAGPSSQEKKVYDNDNLPANGVVSVVGNSTVNEPAHSDQIKDPSAATTSSDKKTDEKKDEPHIKPGQSLEERKQAIDAWQKKLDNQNERIAKAAHELELLQREYTVKSAEFYANTANRAQNPTGFAKDDADYKQKIADKQKALDDEKSKLNDLQDQARREGAPL